jgi:hypothetical protein
MLGSGLRATGIARLLPVQVPSGQLYKHVFQTRIARREAGQTERRLVDSLQDRRNYDVGLGHGQQDMTVFATDPGNAG